MRFRRDPEKDTDKDEQFRIQQELLARRRNGTWQKEVVDRRAEVSRYMKDPEYKRKVDADKRRRCVPGAHPCSHAQKRTGLRRQRRRQRRTCQSLASSSPSTQVRAAVLVGSTPSTRANTYTVGMPEYDGGERFDLRGKYVDNGWVDEDADVMKKVCIVTH